MSDQSPPSEHDQLGWLMGEVDRLRAACLSDALDAGKSRLRVTELEAELEKARASLELAQMTSADNSELALQYHAELEQARKERQEWKDRAMGAEHNEGMALSDYRMMASIAKIKADYATKEGRMRVKAEAELEQARKDAQRWRDALMRIERMVPLRNERLPLLAREIARDALAGDEETV